jgi:hypothetical protein
MSALTDKKQPVQAILIVAIVVLTVAVCVMGWALTRLYSSPKTQAVELSKDADRQEALKAEVQVAIERKIVAPVKLDGMKLESAGEIKGQEIVRFSGVWRPQVGMYVKAPVPPEPATLSAAGLAPEILKWAVANPEKVKGFQGTPNPAAGFTALLAVATPEQNRPISGTIQMPGGPGSSGQEPVVSFDVTVLSEGQPAHTFGPRGLPTESKEYASVQLSKEQMQAQVNQGVMMAFQLDQMQRTGSKRQADLDAIQAKLDKAVADALKAHDAATKASKPAEPAKPAKPVEDPKEAAKKAEEAKAAAEKAAEAAKFAKLLEEKRAAAEKERQAYMAPLLEATKPNKTWIGRWMIDRDGGRLGIKFLTQKPTGEYTGILFDPMDPDSNKSFTGRIVPTPSMNDGWTLTLTSTEGTGINVDGPADTLGARAWLNRGGSAVLYFKLETPSTMIGRSGGRAAFKMELDSGK